MNTRTDKLIAIIAAPMVLAIAALIAYTTLGPHTTHHTAPNLVDQWTTNVLHADPSYQPQFRTQAIRLCNGLENGTITDSDMRLLVWPDQADPDNTNPTNATYTPVQMVTFEWAAVKQYCPEQTGSVPANVTN